jgi:hypothetical protein
VIRDLLLGHLALVLDALRLLVGAEDSDLAEPEHPERGHSAEAPS